MAGYAKIHGVGEAISTFVSASSFAAEFTVQHGNRYRAILALEAAMSRQRLQGYAPLRASKMPMDQSLPFSSG